VLLSNGGRGALELAFSEEHLKVFVQWDGFQLDVSKAPSGHSAGPGWVTCNAPVDRLEIELRGKKGE